MPPFDIAAASRGASDCERRAPTVTIVLPARDAVATIDAALRSVQRQTLDDWECLVVDDGSTDDTAPAVLRAARDDARIRLLSPGRRGLVAALNTGVAAATGRFVARMDADDIMRRERLRAQVAALERNVTWAAVGAHVRMFPRARLTPRRVEYESWLNSLASPDAVRRDAFVECPVAHPTLLARREVLAAFMYRDVAWPEDYDLVLRWLAAGHEIGVVPRRLLAWRDHPGRESRTSERYAGSAFTACKAAFLVEGFLAERRAYVLWGYGDTGRLLRRALLAFDRRPSHIVEVKRGRIGQRIHGAPVIEPAALPALRGTPIVVSVARAEPRALIRRELAAMGFEELRDYVCAA
jgi:glycosyltransferase involved in cell wall biosynthesis